MPHSIPLFEDLLILLLASVPIAFLCNRLRLPALIGFMLTGVLMGPSGFRLIKEAEAVEILAEIGVVLLLFTIGLEFSLRRILEMRHLVLFGGGLQVLLTTGFTTLLVYLLDRPFGQAIFFGFLIALSSTAIVLKSYIDRGEIDTPHGRAGVGILLFQDLCIVPMMLMVPILSGREGSSLANISLTLGTALLAVVIIIFMARILIPRALFHIVRLRSSEVFIIFIVLVSLGTSWVTSQFGLSLALGAFIAGIVLSESEYSHQIVADILPFRDVFNTIFFISIGMLLSVPFVVSHALSVLGWVAALTLGKAIVVFAVLQILRRSVRVSAMTAVGLAQIGEFSFILAKAGVAQGLLTDDDYQRFLAASIISMAVTPLLIMAAPRIGFAVQSLLFKNAELDTTMIGFEPSTELKGHVVIVGYGVNGRNVAKVLGKINIQYLVLELNGDTVQEGSKEGVSILYGDSTRKEVLHKAHLEHARVIVLAISDPIATRHTVALARELNPDIHIIVRTRYMKELPDLYQLGADQVIPEEFETSIEIFSRVLQEYGIARNIIQREIESIRFEGYQTLRLPSELPIQMSDIAMALGSASTETLFINKSSPAIGKTLGELDLRKKTKATVVAAIREGATEVNPGPDFRFTANDIIVLLGSPGEIERAIEEIAEP